VFIQQTLDPCVEMNGRPLEDNERLKTRVDDIERQNEKNQNAYVRVRRHIG
jgi:hypothetical protein